MKINRCFEEVYIMKAEKLIRWAGLTVTGQ
jgi:hypothetical protein